MAKTVGPLVDELLLRLRDTGAASISRAQARRAVAYGVGYAAVSTTDTLEALTLTTERQRLFYNLTETSERIIRVVRATVDNRDLAPADFGVLGGIDRCDWLRDTGDRLESFTQVGKRVLVLYPAIDRTDTVTLYCKTFPTLVTTDSDTVGITDDLVPLALQFGELFLLYRERRFDRLSRQLDKIRASLSLPTREPR